MSGILILLDNTFFKNVEKKKEKENLNIMMLAFFLVKGQLRPFVTNATKHQFFDVTFNGLFSLSKYAFALTKKNSEISHIMCHSHFRWEKHKNGCTK